MPLALSQHRRAGWRLVPCGRWRRLSLAVERPLRGPVTSHSLVGALLRQFNTREGTWETEDTHRSCSAPPDAGVDFEHTRWVVVFLGYSGDVVGSHAQAQVLLRAYVRQPL